METGKTNNPTPVDPRVMWDKVPSVVDRVEEAEVVEAFSHKLTKQDYQNIIAQLHEEAPEDGGEYSIDYKVYEVAAIRNFKNHEARGGDSHNGVWEMVEVIDRDEIEVLGVYNAIDGDEHRAIKNEINQRLKHKLEKTAKLTP